MKGDTSAALKPVVNWMPDYMRNNLQVQTPFGNDEQKPSYIAAFANMKNTEAFVRSRDLIGCRYRRW